MKRMVVMGIISFFLFMSNMLLASEPFVENDGSSIEKAIVLECIYDDITREEEFQISLMYGMLKGWRKTGQKLITQDGKAYDLIKIELDSGEIKEVYFDITKPWLEEYEEGSLSSTPNGR